MKCAGGLGVDKTPSPGAVGVKLPSPPGLGPPPCLKRSELTRARAPRQAGRRVRSAWRSLAPASPPTRRRCARDYLYINSALNSPYSTPY
jgi:hypothetical protein